MSKLYKLIIIVGFAFFLFACKNDKFEDIHPEAYSTPCDTTDSITYTLDIKPIMESKCGATEISCHKTGNIPDVNLDSYAGVLEQATNTADLGGDLLGTILWKSGNNPMPKNSGHLDDCSTNTIIAWVNRNEPE